MKNVFEELTAFIPQIKEDAFGEWIVDRKNDGTPEHPMQMPYVNYSEVVDNFIETLYQFCDRHTEFEHTQYGKTLHDYGLEWGKESMSKADVNSMNAKGVIALLIGAVRAERFCDGALLAFFESGCILRWLERLAEIDNE